MEYRILGPLEVRAEGRLVELRGPRQRALLAVLLLHAGEAVSTDRLIDLVWGDAPPDGARKALSVRVSQLRKALQQPGSAGGAIVTRPTGYAIEVGAEQLDLLRFEHLNAAGVEALDTGDARTASATLRAALDLWRGPPLADFAFEEFAQGHIARLEELRIGAFEDRIAADLELGRQAKLIGELEGLVADHPFRERLHGQLMLALYRCGRQAEALQAYRTARRTLVEGVGIEPARELRELERRILAQDASLRAPERPGGRRAAQPRRASAFVGRERELDELLVALADARAGHGRLALIGGEPGIGKSRLADELAERAEELGARVLFGRCWEAGGAPAYWPWVHSLRSYVREREPAALRQELGIGGSDLAQLLPEVGELFPDLVGPPTRAAEGDRFRLFDSVVGFLRNAARAQPLLVVLDDLHAADAPSLLLLRFVASELDDISLMLLGAYRQSEIGRDHRLTATFAELDREPGTRRLMLPGLSEAAVARYIELTTGIAPPESLAAAVHRGTEGNPLFVGEFTHLLDDERLLEREALERLPIPQGVRDTIGHRLRRLSAECRRVLGLASGLGREFSLAALGRLGGVSGDDLLELLDEALAARILDEVPGARDSLRFSHALVRDVLYEELGAARRVRLHREIADTLVSLYSLHVAPHLGEIAHHYFEAIPHGDPDCAIDYSKRAGEHAAGLLAYEEAARLFRMALEALDRDGYRDAAARCELLLALGEVDNRAGDIPTARTASGRPQSSPDPSTGQSCSPRPRSDTAAGWCGSAPTTT